MSWDRALIVGLALAVVASALVAPALASHGPARGSAAAPRLDGALGAHGSDIGLSVHPDLPTAIPTGSVPDALLVDPANGTAYVASQLDGNVTVISLGTNQAIGTIPVGSEPYPQAIALDSTNWTVWVANSGSGNVSVISIAQGLVTASITVGASPDAIAVNPGNHDIYVANGGAGTVTIISPATALPHVIATVPVGPDPDALAVNTVTHNVFVADAGNGNISVISGATNAVIATRTVGTAPGPYGAMVFNPANGNVYVANFGSGNVSVVGGGNFTPFASIPVGSGPIALALDATTKTMFVANHFSNNVSVISTKTNRVVASVTVGNQPSTDGALAFNPVLGTLYVPNGGTNDVSVVSAAKNSVVATVPVGAIPDAIGVNPLNGSVYAANQGSSNVSEFVVAQVTFRSAGLPPGTPWGISAGSPPVLHANTTVHGKGLISFTTTSLNLAYSIHAPAGYGVARVSGPRAPSQIAVTLVGSPSTFVVQFGPLESLTFAETGLPAATLWGLTIQPGLAHGGPAAQSASTTGTTLNFTVVKDAWKYRVSTGPTTFRAVPSHGSVAVGIHPVSKTIKFKPVTAVVLFEVVGLARGTSWSVNATGPIDLGASSTGGTIRLLLVNGTYTFTASNVHTLFPHPATGIITVVVPHAPLVVIITYTNTPGHSLPAAPPPMPVASVGRARSAPVVGDR